MRKERKCLSENGKGSRLKWFDCRKRRRRLITPTLSRRMEERQRQHSNQEERMEQLEISLNLYSEEEVISIIALVRIVKTGTMFENEYSSWNSRSITVLWWTRKVCWKGEIFICGNDIVFFIRCWNSFHFLGTVIKFLQVVADKNGNTVVYNDKDVPIGTGTVKKTGPRSYEVSHTPKELLRWTTKGS